MNGKEKDRELSVLILMKLCNRSVTRVSYYLFYDNKFITPTSSEFVTIQTVLTLYSIN